MDKQQSERAVRYLVSEFETAIRMMIRDKSTMHAFDFKGDGQPWSLVILMAPKPHVEALERIIGGTIPSTPLEFPGEQNG